jgi:hypothetical protein
LKQGRLAHLGQPNDTNPQQGRLGTLSVNFEMLRTFRLVDSRRSKVKSGPTGNVCDTLHTFQPHESIILIQPHLTVLHFRGRRACDIKVGVLPLLHDIFVKAYGGSSRVVRGARLAGDRT